MSCLCRVQTNPPRHPPVHVPDNKLAVAFRNIPHPRGTAAVHANNRTPYYNVTNYSVRKPHHFRGRAHFLSHSPALDVTRYHTGSTYLFCLGATARAVSDPLLYREFEGLPTEPACAVKYLDVRCPTCGRTARMIALEAQAS